MEFSSQEYWSRYFLLQGIFLTQGSNLGLLHCRWILYQLSHQGSPRLWQDLFMRHQKYQLTIGGEVVHLHLGFTVIHPCEWRETQGWAEAPSCCFSVGVSFYREYAFCSVKSPVTREIHMNWHWSLDFWFGLFFCYSELWGAWHFCFGCFRHLAPTDAHTTESYQVWAASGPSSCPLRRWRFTSGYRTHVIQRPFRSSQNTGTHWVCHGCMQIFEKSNACLKQCVRLLLKENKNKVKSVVWGKYLAWFLWSWASVICPCTHLDTHKQSFCPQKESALTWQVASLNLQDTRRPFPQVYLFVYTLVYYRYRALKTEPPPGCLAFFREPLCRWHWQHLIFLPRLVYVSGCWCSASCLRGHIIPAVAIWAQVSLTAQTASPVSSR